MIKLSISYKENIKASSLEQAAGFPPFTRGYNVVQEKLNFVTKDAADFVLTDYEDSSIIDLFTLIISRQAKGKITLSLPILGKPEEIIGTRVLRTLLSFVSDKKYKNATEIQFQFIGNTQNVTNPIIALNIAKAAQINCLNVEDLDIWKQVQLYSPINPVDSSFGSNYIEEETLRFFLRIWSKIDLILT